MSVARKRSELCLRHTRRDVTCVARRPHHLRHTVQLRLRVDDVLFGSVFSLWQARAEHESDADHVENVLAHHGPVSARSRISVKTASAAPSVGAVEHRLAGAHDGNPVVHQRWRPEYLRSAVLGPSCGEVKHHRSANAVAVVVRRAMHEVAVEHE